MHKHYSFKLLLIFAFLLVVVAPAQVTTAAVETEVIKLFDATPTTNSGFGTDFSQVFAFASILVDLDTDGLLSAKISSSESDPDAEIVVDNFITHSATELAASNTVDSASLCPGDPRTCFSSSSPPYVAGSAIETELGSVPALDVTAALIDGENWFQLWDFGVIYGNTPLWLHITRDVPDEPGLCGDIEFQHPDVINPLDAETPQIVVRYGNCGQQAIPQPRVVCDVNADDTILPATIDRKESFAQGLFIADGPGVEGIIFSGYQLTGGSLIPGQNHNVAWNITPVPAVFRCRLFTGNTLLDTDFLEVTVRQSGGGGQPGDPPGGDPDALIDLSQSVYTLGTYPGAKVWINLQVRNSGDAPVENVMVSCVVTGDARIEGFDNFGGHLQNVDISADQMMVTTMGVASWAGGVNLDPDRQVGSNLIVGGGPGMVTCAVSGDGGVMATDTAEIVMQ